MARYPIHAAKNGKFVDTPAVCIRVPVEKPNNLKVAACAAEIFDQVVDATSHSTDPEDHQSTCVGCQGAEAVFQVVPSRSMALRIVSSLRMQAMRATFLGLWRASNWW